MFDGFFTASFFGATTFFGGFTDGFTTGVHSLGGGGGGSSGKSLSSIFFVLVDGSCTSLDHTGILRGLLEVLLVLPFGRFTLEDKPRMLSADTSVLGIDVHAGIRGAGSNFCASFFCGVTGLFTLEETHFFD